MGRLPHFLTHGAPLRASVFSIEKWNKPDLTLTTAWLAQCDKRRSAEREAAGWSPGRTNTQGL